ncbi:O-antigen ligase family protein [Exiguobacterium indicum]|uniref:O-antigen ligase family protein n=1 Tax=Exiguobacterium indicum TaxID=296995 RepID=UPI0039822F86
MIIKLAINKSLKILYPLLLIGFLYLDNKVSVVLAGITLISIVCINYKKPEFLISGFYGAFIMTIVVNQNFIGIYTLISMLFCIFIYKFDIKKVFNKFNIIVFLFFVSSLLALHNVINFDFYSDGVLILLICLSISLSISLIPLKSLNINLIFSELNYYSFIFICLFFSTHYSIEELLNTPRALIYFNGNSEVGIRSNTISGFLIIFSLFNIGYLVNNKSKTKNWISIFSIILNLTALFFLQTRGAIVALAFIGGIILTKKIIKTKRINLKKITALSFLVVISLLFCIFNINYISEFRIFNTDNSDYSNGRFEIYKEALKYFNYHPIIGNGLYQFGPLKGSYTIEDPHNWVIYYLLSTGIVGTLLFCLTILTLLNGNRSIDRLNFIKYGALATIIHGLFEPTLSTSLPLLLFFITSSIYFHINNQQQNQENGVEHKNEKSTNLNVNI